MSLSVLVKPAGPDCNLACTYCFYKPLLHTIFADAPRHRMSLETFELFVRQFMPLAGPIANFAWQGGEPTLMGLPFFERAFEIERAHTMPRQRITNALQTNGTLVTKAWGKFLHDHGVLVGLSLDGPRDIHDAARMTEANTPTFDRVLRAAEMLKRSRAEFNILVVLSERSAGRAAEIDDFLSRHGFNHVQYIPVVEYDITTGEVAEYSITPNGYGDFLCELFDRWAADWPPRRFIREFDEWLMVYAGYPPPTCIIAERCGGYVVLEHNGDVYCCDFAVEPGWCLGNIHETPLVEMVGSERFRAFSARHAELPQQCRECRYRPLCNGGCPQHRVRAHGTHVAPTYFCAGLRRFFAHSERRFRGMARRAQQLSSGTQPVPRFR